MPDSSSFYLPVARALAQTRIVRERLLPRPGEAQVGPDERVEPDDIVGRAYVPVPPIVYNVAQNLNVPTHEVRRLLVKKIGDTFDAHDVIARRKRPFRSPMVCRARAPGRLLAEYRGEVLLESALVPMDLFANARGVVVNASRFGVVVHSSGGLIQGVWGNGKESYGVMKVLGATREQPLTADLIDVSCLGTIIVVGGPIEPEGLKQAKTQQLRGIVAGSMSATLREQALAAAFPIMLTEGFGALAMAAPAYQIIKASTSREASLRAISQTRWGAQRPELVIPVSAREAVATEAPPAHSALESGVLVRICAGDNLGHTGRVLSAHPQTRILSSGARARAVEVALQDNETVWVAINNLEAIE
jgi:hypothetical protein